MSSLLRSITWVAVLLVMLGVAWSGRRVAEARSDVARAEQRLIGVRRQLGEIADLRARPSGVSRASRVSHTSSPASGMVEEVGAALTRAGLPSSTLTSLSPGQETVIGSGTTSTTGTTGITGEGEIRRRVQRLVLEPVPLPALGKFLEAWRTAHSEWSVTLIEVAPLDAGLRARGDAGSAGGITLTPVRAAMTMESTVLIERAPSRDATGVPGAHP